MVSLTKKKLLRNYGVSCIYAWRATSLQLLFENNSRNGELARTIRGDNKLILHSNTAWFEFLGYRTRIYQQNKLPNIQNQHGRLKAESEALAKEKTERIIKQLPWRTHQAIEQTQQKGASSWLACVPLEEHGFTLTKSEFRDTLVLRYNRTIKDLPTSCSCSQKFDVNHELTCKRGDFIIMRHDTLRDFEANLLKHVCNDVEVEPRLQPRDEHQRFITSRPTDWNNLGTSRSWEETGIQPANHERWPRNIHATCFLH